MELTVISRKEVYLDGKLLDLGASLKRRSHSPTGFSWGYHGSGCAQLALAVMMEMLKGSSFSVDYEDGKLDVKKHYQDFKRDVIAKLDVNKSVALEMDFWAWFHGSDAYRFEKKILGDIHLDDEEQENRICTFPEKCQKATCEHCDCSCGGTNHKLQSPLF